MEADEASTSPRGPGDRDNGATINRYPFDERQNF
jgi:hypothetical protein